MLAKSECREAQRTGLLAPGRVPRPAPPSSPAPLKEAVPVTGAAGSAGGTLVLQEDPSLCFQIRGVAVSHSPACSAPISSLEVVGASGEGGGKGSSAESKRRNPSSWPQ